MANQTIRTPEKEAALLSALRERPSYASACRKAKISRAAFYEWLADDAKFADRVAQARNQGLDAIEDALVSRGLKNDTTAAIFLLKSHRREIYGDKVAVDHGGKIRHEIVDLSIYTDDELELLERLAEKREAGLVAS